MNFIIVALIIIDIADSCYLINCPIGVKRGRMNDGLRYVSYNKNRNKSLYTVVVVFKVSNMRKWSWNVFWTKNMLWTRYWLFYRYKSVASL